MAELFEIPDGLLMAAAQYQGSFDALSRRLRAKPLATPFVYENLPSLSQNLRCIGIKLGCGRFAAFSKLDRDHLVSIDLQFIEVTRKDFGESLQFFLSDLEEICQFAQIDQSDIRRLDNGYVWK